jgi:hypothetical protein
LVQWLERALLSERANDPGPIYKNWPSCVYLKKMTNEGTGAIWVPEKKIPIKHIKLIPKRISIKSADTQRNF